MKYLNPGSGQLDFNWGRGGGGVVTNVGIIVEKMHVFRTAVKADLSGTGWSRNLIIGNLQRPIMSLSSHSVALSLSMLHSHSYEIVSSESPTYLTLIIPSVHQNIYLCDKAKIVFCREYRNIVCYFCLLVWQDCAGHSLCLKLLTVTYHILPLLSPPPSSTTTTTENVLFFLLVK